MTASRSNPFPTGTDATAFDFGSPVAKNAAHTKQMQRLPDSVFEEISRNLEANLQKKEWANRPRTWYILNQINRLDLMDAFILQGLNDTCIPYKGRHSLPHNLDRFEYESFLEWQECAQSDILLLERGSHVRVSNGDLLFEGRRVKLGVGSQGSSRVDRVKSKMTGKIYARKIINKSKRFGYDNKALKTYENEIKTLGRPDLEENDHLIKIKGTYTDSKNLAMLLEPVADGNLKEHMIESNIASEAERQRFRTYFGCLAHTIRFLHGLEILHKDIKPENVLLKNGHLILTDFGTAFDWSHTHQSMTRSNAEDRRTPRYQSPEVANAGEFHRASDIWSLGVLFLEMATVLQGRGLAQMDEFIQHHGTGRMYTYENLEGVMKWVEALGNAHPSRLRDNDILMWVQQMLNSQLHLRPTAETLHQTIIAVSDGEYCGKCCFDDEADSDDSQMTSEAGTVTPSSIMEKPLVEASDLQKMTSQFLPYEIPTSQALNSTENKPSKFKKRKSTTGHGMSDWILPPQTASPNIVNSENQGASQKTSHKGKMFTTGGALSFPGREAIVQWLFTTAKRLKSSGPSGRLRIPKKRQYTFEGQQIGHFLSTLPEELGDYENANDRPEGDRSLSNTDKGSLMRSRSYENFESAFESIDIEEGFDATEGLSKNIHYASDTHLPLTSQASKEDRQHSFKSLQEFAILSPTLIPRNASSSQVASPISANADDNRETESLLPQQAGQLIIPDSREISQNSRQSSDQNALGLDFANLAGPGVEHLKRTVEERFRSTQNPSARLGEWIDGKDVGKRQTHKNRLESATVIMEKILKNKTAEAPTTVMSANSRAIFSKGQSMTRWNEEYYGYLPYYVGMGKAQTVRCLLAAGCNPGTKSKPRPNLIFKAVRRASDRHNKCLRALVEFGADVNYKLRSNGRSPIHYAIEQESWSGYSTVIYVLLAARANPNVKDKAGDVPLLMLLSGKGLLPQQRQDALFLLLAPNFITSLDVTCQGTLDNPLHLVIRRKDAYALNAILDKMKRDGETATHLLHDRNKAGFSPLLLAISLLSITEAASGELHIIKLLLEYQANPNDHDLATGDTCLHWVVTNNQSAVALELLCRHNANTNIPNTAGVTPLDLVESAQNKTPADHWSLFAKRRMINELKEGDYRPPELTQYLKEENGAS